MRSVIPMWIAKIINILTSICFCVLGIIVLAMPKIPDSAVGLAVGIMLILLGAFKLVGYLSRDLFRLAFQHDLQLGFVLMLLGLAVLIEPEYIMNFVCVIFGISIFAEGLCKISVAIDSKKFGIKSWLAILIIAVATCIYGALLVVLSSLSSNGLAIHLGISLIWEGVLNLIVVLFTVKIINNQRPDRITD